jgi:Ca2+-binding RTX toxin-like protein
MQCPPSTLRVVDGKAERNDITVEAAGADMVVRDAAAPLEAGNGCRQEPDGSVRCPATSSLDVDAGDGDDRVVVPFGRAIGGPGADELVGGEAMFGGPGADTLRSGDGRGYLDGGADADVVEGGGSDDTIVDDDGPLPAADRLDGGEGSDTISFAPRTLAVSIDLGAVPQQGGQAAEANTLAGFETAVGGAGDDTIAGSAGDDALDGRGGEDDLVGRGGDDELLGGAGDDAIAGGAGADFVSGGKGHDRLDGGKGDDRVDGKDRAADDIDCGPGRDSAKARRGERALRCESLRRLRGRARPAR